MTLCGIHQRPKVYTSLLSPLIASVGLSVKDATLSCPSGYQCFEEGVRLLDSDKNPKSITTFQWSRRGKSRGVLAMKTLFIPAKIKSKVNKPKILSLSKKLPKNIALTYSIQYQDIANEIKNILGKEKKITKFVQVLGCSKPRVLKNTQAILLIGSGRFHAISLAKETRLPIYILENNNLSKVSKQDIGSFDKKQKASYVKFLNADKIGILISTKPGQQNLKKALALKKKLKNKNSYLFIGDNLNPSEFENFGLNSWVNTACPRMDMESDEIINLDKIK